MPFSRDARYNPGREKRPRVSSGACRARQGSLVREDGQGMQPERRATHPWWRTGDPREWNSPAWKRRHWWKGKGSSGSSEQHWFKGHELGWTPGDGEERLWGRKESDVTWRLNNSKVWVVKPQQHRSSHFCTDLTTACYPLTASGGHLGQGLSLSFFLCTCAHRQGGNLGWGRGPLFTACHGDDAPASWVISQVLCEGLIHG